MKKISIAVITIIVAFGLAIMISFFALLGMQGFFSKPKITTDASKYAQLRSGPSAKENYQDRWGMDESIWPEEITESMEVKDYKMVYYDPWGAQYLGYLVVKYPDSEYKAKIDRLFLHFNY